MSERTRSWCTDITYIRLVSEFVYLVAIMDWFSRYVLSWKVSNSLDAEFCVVALQHALLKAKPEIFNSDQGSQFTSSAFTRVLEEAGVRISMDGGVCLTISFKNDYGTRSKYEAVYLQNWHHVPEAKAGLDDYFTFYNHIRPHQTLLYAIRSIL